MASYDAGIFSIFGLFYLLGVVAVDLTVDLSARTEWATNYYATHVLAAFPVNAFLPVGMLLAFGGLFINVIRKPKDWRNWGSIILSLGLGWIFGIGILPRLLYLSEVAQKGQYNQKHNRTRIPAELETIKKGHLEVAFILLVVILLQLSSAAAGGGTTTGGSKKTGGMTTPSRRTSSGGGGEGRVTRSSGKKEK